MSGSDDRRLVDGLVQLTFAVHGVLTEVGAEHDLSVTQVRLLGILRDRTLPMSDVASHLGLDRSSVTGLVARAEQRGLVERFRSAADGRGVLVGMTTEGRDLVRTAEDVVRRRIVALAAPLSGPERSRLLALAEKLVRLPDSS